MPTKLRRSQGGAAFPPYQLLDADYIAETHERTKRLERIYHVAHDKAWDGRKVLAELIERHGGISLPDDKRAAIGKVFSIILWGELAAWVISAELAERLPDVEARMAATSQAFDEARHFFVMRDYLLALDIELPPLDGFSHAVLSELLATDSLVRKLIGMQLMVEHVALNLFKLVAETRVEPVLADLLPYFVRDEARHVALGTLYLPQMLKGLGSLGFLEVAWTQAKIQVLLTWATVMMRDSFETLGLDTNGGLRFGGRELTRSLQAIKEGAPRGVVILPKPLRRLNSLSIDYFFPPRDVDPPAWQRACLKVLSGVGNTADRVLRATG